MSQQIDFILTIKAILYAFVIYSISELINYYLVYRTEDYQSLTNNIENISNKLKKLNEFGLETSKGNTKKKSTLESRFKSLQMEMTTKKLKSNLCTAILMLTSMYYLNKSYHGVVVAKLPFIPIGLIQGLTHRNLEGDDMTDCSFIFLYVLMGMVFRNNIAKIFGFEGPQNLYNPLQESFKNN